MIAFLRGVLVQKDLTNIALDVSGVGYSLGISSATYASLPDLGTELCIYTHLQVREDAFVLFGFATLEELEMFKKLISVSGIGPKVALSALSALSIDSLRMACINQDVSLLTKVPGLGKKTAGRLVLELKDAFNLSLSDTSVPLSASAKLQMSAKTMAGEALLSLGFSQAEVQSVLESLDDSLGEEQLIAQALRQLGSS